MKILSINKCYAKINPLTSKVSSQAKKVCQKLAPYGIAATALYSTIVPCMNIISEQKSVETLKTELIDNACSCNSLNRQDISPEEIVDIADALDFYEKNNGMNYFSITNKKEKLCKDWILYYAKNTSSAGLEISSQEKLGIKDALENNIKCPEDSEAKVHEVRKDVNNVAIKYLRSYYLNNSYR